MSEQIFTVQGMTCGHCAQAVTAEISAIEGVTGVAVDLESGVVTVFGDQISRDAVAAAVDEAGYQLT